MYDKTVRRRRAVLALLVALSLILLTAYFGEASSGGLHSLQNGFLTVVSPIQDGANKALKPVRDMFGWFGSTLKAKSQNAKLRRELAAAQRQASAIQLDRHGYSELLRLYHLDQTLSIADYRPVTTTVDIQSANVWNSKVGIEAGSSAGVRVNDPVIDDEGLIGEVSRVVSDGAIVSLITDSEVQVSARVSATGTLGMVQAQVGEPGRLLMSFLTNNAPVARGDYVVTSGTVAGNGESLFPPGIPIGTVTSENEHSAYKSLNVSPLADLRNLDTVQVLTAPPGSRAASTGATVASLAPSESRGEQEGGAAASTEASG
ncbi:MAG TPA: rod shape-determining protein MreC [Solirubrobacteraceae bacterium]|nr:rod shape-determining protein MreC [Solirubrobacteraceae bacterium]